MLLAGLASAWWAGLIALLLGSTGLALLQPALARRRSSQRERPPVSVLVPLRRIEEADSEANRALARLDYPQFEVLFSVRRDQPYPPLEGEGRGEASGWGDQAPSAGMLWRGKLYSNQENHPTPAFQADPPPPGEGKRTRLLLTTPIPDANPKIANLIEPAEAAAHDFLLVKDTATVLPPETLAAMVASLTLGVGLVAAVPVARQPGNFAAALEASLINTYGGRMLLALSALGGGAGIGAAMLLRRADLEAAGGLRAIAHALADDHALAKLLQRRGLRPVFAAATVDQALGPRRPAEIWRRHLRWAICRRLEEPLAFAVEPLIGLPAACLMVLAGAAFLGLPSMPMLIATLVAWPAAECLLAWRKGWPLGWTMPPAILLREMLMPALWLHALLARRLAWGATTLNVAAGRR